MVYTRCCNFIQTFSILFKSGVWTGQPIQLLLFLALWFSTSWARWSGHYQFVVGKMGWDYGPQVVLKVYILVSIYSAITAVTVPTPWFVIHPQVITEVFCLDGGKHNLDTRPHPCATKHRNGCFVPKTSWLSSEKNHFIPLTVHTPIQLANRSFS
jgi:hypothetical protein